MNLYCHRYQGESVDKVMIFEGILNNSQLILVIPMGNEQQASEYALLTKQQNRLKEAELTDTESLEESVYEQREEDTNCFGCIKVKRTVLKKVDWEYKFLRNCSQIVEEFEWARQLAEAVSCFDLPKNKGIHEVNNLKKEKYVARSEADNKPSEKELQAFRRNLKKSVIMSFSSKVVTDTRQSIMNVKKSRIEQQKNPKIKSDILVERSMSGRSRDNVKRSIIEFVDEGQPQSQSQITKSTTHQLQVFMKFSNILEIHLNDHTCVLGRIKSEFIKVMARKYNDPVAASASLGDFVDDIKQFLLLMKQGVVDYYGLGSFAEGEINMLIANEQNVLSSCTSILFKDHQFYNLLFAAVSHHFHIQEAKFTKILNFLKGSGPERFSVKDKFCLNHRTLKAYLNQLSMESGENIVENIEIDQSSENYDPFRKCQQSLNQLVKSRSPVNKMKAIAACSEGITRQIEAFYDRNCLVKEKWMLDADQVLSIFAYIIVAARVEHLHTQLFLLDNFANGFQMINMTGYYMAVLNCAVEHLENQFGELVPE